MSSAKHVRIVEDKLQAFAAKLEELTHLQPPNWDDGNWHYSDGGPLTAQYVLVLDALNWCFWPSSTGMEYDTLASSLKRVLEADHDAFSAGRLSQLDARELRSWFTPHDLPNAEERARKLRELGAVLSARFGGLAINLVKEAGQSAVALVRLLVESFPGFRDEAVYGGRQVFLYKRAQIAVADVWAAYGRSTAGEGPCAFSDIASLTCFPDYRLPQLMRAEGVLAYDAPTCAAVDGRQELPPGSPQEVEIRAATVVAVERLRDALNGRIRAARGAQAGAAPDLQELTAVELDWYLWQIGERRKDALQPHHRVDTVFY